MHCRPRSMTALFTWNQGNTRGHRPSLQPLCTPLLQHRCFLPGTTLFCHFLRAFFQELSSFVISFEFLVRNNALLPFPSSFFPGTQLFCDFLRVFSQEQRSFAISFQFFS